VTIRSDVRLAAWCTLEVGGPARWFCQAHDEDELAAAVEWAHSRGVAVHILGGGSNVVFADRGFDGLVIRIDIAGIRSSRLDNQIVFSAGAGEPWDPLVAATIDAGCAGLECLSGIPGQVGGTPIQNVGAYGQDVSATITEVRAFDRQTDKVLTLSNADCAFGYRTSRFKREDSGRFVITRVDFALVQGGQPTMTYADVVAFFEREQISRPTLPDVRAAVLRIRRGKGMVIEQGNTANRSVGSFFVNPVISRVDFERISAAYSNVPHYPAGLERIKVPAAWLIEQAGFRKGLRRGALGVSPFQAQAIVNHGGATAAEVIALATDIKQAVWTRFGVVLVPEPVFVGFPPAAGVEWLLNPRPHE
jgi:UDP-N-acetylmuramate dehydrogenase